MPLLAVCFIRVADKADLLQSQLAGGAGRCRITRRGDGRDKAELPEPFNLHGVGGGMAIVNEQKINADKIRLLGKGELLRRNDQAPGLRMGGGEQALKHNGGERGRRIRAADNDGLHLALCRVVEADRDLEGGGATRSDFGDDEAKRRGGAQIPLYGGDDCMARQNGGLDQRPLPCFRLRGLPAAGQFIG